MSYFFPKFYDFLMRPVERRMFEDIRKELIHKAKGNVIEIGSGTGVNFRFYKAVNRLTAVEPNAIMREKSIARIKGVTFPIEITDANAESLPYDDNSFDSAVVTLVFCSISDPVKAVNELRRVCKPGAPILFFEHVRVAGWRGRLQDILTPVWRQLCDGCHLNRSTEQLIESAGLTITSTARYFNDLFLVIECTN